MKIKLSIFLVVVGILLVVIHDEMTGGMTILSDIPNDPTVSDGWPWCIGAAGILSALAGIVIGLVERIQRDKQVEQPAFRRGGDSTISKISRELFRQDTIKFLERKREA